MAFHKTIEKTLKIRRKTGIRALGNHPETGEPINCEMAIFGPVASNRNSKQRKQAQVRKPFKKSLIKQ